MGVEVMAIMTKVWVDQAELSSVGMVARWVNRHETDTDTRSGMPLPRIDNMNNSL
jgi:hypothetical protein